MSAKAQDIESAIEKLVAEGIAGERISVEDIRGYVFVKVDQSPRAVFRTRIGSAS
jgi:hypothetical protein